MAEQLGPGNSADKTMLLHLEDGQDGCNPVILTALRGKCTARYKDMRTRNDFRVLLCTWLFELRFAATLREIRQSGCFDAILGGFTGSPEIKAELFAVVESRLNTVL
jgi:hypothetical protein